MTQPTKQTFTIAMESDSGIDLGQIAVAIENIGGDVMFVAGIREPASENTEILAGRQVKELVSAIMEFLGWGEDNAEDVARAEALVTLVLKKIQDDLEEWPEPEIKAG